MTSNQRTAALEPATCLSAIPLQTHGRNIPLYPRLLDDCDAFVYLLSFGSLLTLDLYFTMDNNGSEGKGPKPLHFG